MEGFPLVGLVDRAFHFHFPYMCPQVVYFYGQEFMVQHVKTMVPDSNKGYNNFENLLTQMQRLQKRGCKWRLKDLLPPLRFWDKRRGNNNPLRFSFFKCLFPKGKGYCLCIARYKDKLQWLLRPRYPVH